MDEKLKYKIRLAIKQLGLKQSRQMFGDDIIRQVYNNNPLLFLNQFNNLTPVEEDGDVIYVDNNDEILFSYYKKDQDSKNGFYWIRRAIIIKFLEEIMGYTHDEIKEIMKGWLKVNYNLGELSPKWIPY
jgi:hypothetical protein